MEDYIQALKSLSEKTRIRILAILHQAKEACVSEIVEVLGESQYNISRHLKVLQNAGMVVSSKKGRWIYYQLNDNQDHFKKVILNAVQEISSDILKNDLERLQKRLSERIDGQCMSKMNDTYNESYR